MQDGLINIKDVDSFCLENTWWDQKVNEAFSFSEKQFFATGDICFDDDCTTQIMLFNKKLHTDNGIESPYESVKKGTWTLDTLVKNMEAGYKDLNGDGVMDKNDSYGLSAGVGTFPEFMIYCNAPFTVINEEGYPEFAYTNNSEKLINTFDAIFNKLIVNPGCVVTEYDLGADYAGARNMFANNQFLYCFQAIGSLQSLRNDMESDFGVIPGPKLDELQEKHYANGSMWASMYGSIPLAREKMKYIPVFCRIQCEKFIKTG